MIDPNFPSNSSNVINLFTTSRFYTLYYIALIILLIVPIFLAAIIYFFLMTNPAITLGSVFFPIALSIILVSGLRLFVIGPRINLALKHFIIWSPLLLVTAVLFLSLRPEQLFTYESMIIFSFSLITLLSLFIITQKILFTFDVETKTLIMTAYSSILGGSKETRIKREEIKAGILIFYPKLRTLELVTITDKKLGITAPGENTSFLYLLALYLINYFHISIKLEGNRIPKEKRNKEFGVEIFKKRQKIFPSNKSITQLEKELHRTGWQKIQNKPMILLQKGLTKNQRDTALFCLIGLVGSLSVLLLLFFIQIDFGELGLYIYSFVVLMIVLFLGWSVGYSLPMLLGLNPNMVKIDEIGVQKGRKIIGRSSWGPCWPYVFIQALRIDELKKGSRLTIEYFLGAEKLAESVYKEAISVFQEYICALCAEYQKDSPIELIPF